MYRPAFLVSLILLSVIALAQQPAAAPGPEITLHVTTHLVYVDVVARDSKGNVMRGLTQQDFRILEDGRPVAIDFFTAHLPAPPSSVKMIEPPPEVAKDEFANFTAGDTSKPLTIVLYDLLNTPNDDQLTARQQMLKFLDALPPGERITVFALTNGLQMTQVLTGDPAARKAVSTMLRPRDVGLDASKNVTMNDLKTAANPAMADAVIIAESQNYDARARSTIPMLAEVARAMENYPGRKSLYWLAESFPLSIDLSTGPVNKGMGGPTGHVSAAQLTTSGTSKQAGNFSQTSNFSHTSQLEMSTTLNLLASARIAVYPVSVFGLSTESSSPAVTGMATGDPRGGFFAMSNLKSEMQDLARETGGEAIFGTNDIAGAMERTRNDGAIYYTLIYKPTNNQWDGRFRKIQVEAEGSGSLIYRRGYFATSGGMVTDGGDDLRLAMRPGVPEETSLRLRTKLLPNDPQHPGLLVETTLTTEDVAFTTSPDGHRHATLFVQIAAFNDGKQQPKSLPQTAGTLHIDLDSQRYEFIRSAGIAYRQQLTLKPGKYRVVLGVIDESSRKLGTLEVPVTIPAS
jgi:VWFA-related protein